MAVSSSSLTFTPTSTSTHRLLGSPLPPSPALSPLPSSPCRCPVRLSVLPPRLLSVVHPPPLPPPVSSHSPPPLQCASAMSGEHKAVVISNPTKEGYLEKQSRVFKRWRKRWFVLQDSTLYSFKKERVYDAPTEIIDLRVFSSVKSSEDYTHRAHSFDVYSTDQVFSMVAPAESDKEGQQHQPPHTPHAHTPCHAQPSCTPHAHVACRLLLADPSHHRRCRCR